MRTAAKTAITLALAAGLLMPSFASALTRMPTARNMVKPTKELLLKKLNPKPSMFTCTPPYTMRNLTIRTKQLPSTPGVHVRLVKFDSSKNRPSMWGGMVGTAKITASIAPNCGIKYKLTNFKSKMKVPLR